MVKVSKEVFENYGKKRLQKLLSRKEPVDVVAGFVDVFGDSILLPCSKCGTPVYIRPWLVKAIHKKGWKVVCICCADPLDLKGQLAIDSSRIETEVR